MTQRSLYRCPCPMATPSHPPRTRLRCRRFLNELAPNFGILGAPLLPPERDLATEAADLYAANVPSGALVVGTHIR